MTAPTPAQRAATGAETPIRELIALCIPGKWDDALDEVDDLIKVITELGFAIVPRDLLDAANPIQMWAQAWSHADPDGLLDVIEAALDEETNTTQRIVNNEMWSELSALIRPHIARLANGAPNE